MHRDDDTRDLSPTHVDDVRTTPVNVDDAPLVADADRYASVAMLGKGGMGEIRLCKDSRIARQVAVKMLRGALRDEPEYRARFLREARLQGQLEHPAIVPVHDLGTTGDGDLYFTMKRVRGATLQEALTAIAGGDRTRFSRRRLLTAFSSVCLAVDFAHSRGVVHRDLKPSNVMLGDFGEVYVLDWGIAKVMHRADAPLGEGVEVPDADTPTRVGAVMGTPRYMAPEQRMGHADARSDVFSLGLILGEILACDRDAPPELVAIASHATQPEPEDRYVSARELHDAIERFLDGDRDLEARKRAADEHAHHAEQALERAQIAPTADARVEAGRHVGRALGMEPGNVRALRALARLLRDMPDHLPPAAQAAMERRWLERSMRMAKSGILVMLAFFAFIPFAAALGVREWGALGAFTGFVVGALMFHWLSRGQIYVWQRAMTYVMTLGALAMMSRSMGLLGVLPVAMTLVLLAYRLYVVSWQHGLALSTGTFITLLLPFVLEWLHVIPPIHVFRDSGVTIVPQLHALPPTLTQLYLITSCAFALGVTVIYARQYVVELRRAEARAAFHTWQLEQLLPPDEHAV